MGSIQKKEPNKNKNEENMKKKKTYKTQKVQLSKV